MGLGTWLDRFAAERPVAVMYRALLERVLSAERMNALFRDTAVEQYESPIAFSTVVDILGEVVTRQQKHVNTAYKAYGGKPTVGGSVAALYEKMAKVEPAVAERLVRQTAADLAEIIGCLPSRRSLLPGIRLRIADGKQLSGTDHRLKETRPRREAVLPGKLVPVLDPDRELVLGVVTTEDAHTNERKLWDGILALLEEGDCLVADRIYCTKGSLLRLAARKMLFVIRQHPGDCPVEELGPRQRLGRTDSGTVYEQSVRLEHEGQTLTLRRITVRLNKPTGKGEKEIHILTNLPAKFGGRKIAEVYRHRWKIEQAFQSLAEALRGEVNTLGYPRAALLGYCLALVAYNFLSTVKAVVHSAHPESSETKLSSYYMADEVARAWDGLDLTIPPRTWQRQFVTVTLTQFIRKLRTIAQHVPVSRFASTHRKPKHARRQLPRGKCTHLSTFRLLSTRQPARK